MKIGNFVIGYECDAMLDLLTSLPQENEKLLHAANQHINNVRDVIEPFERVRLYKWTVTEILDVTINDEGIFILSPQLYHVKGLLIVRGGGMVFVGDDKAKAYKIEPHDAKSIFNNLLLPLGYKFGQDDKHVLNATAAVFEDRAIIRSIEPQVKT